MQDTLPTERARRKPYITAQTLELADKKRLLKLRRHESREANNEYKRMRNVVRKAAREDKEKWLTDKCREIQRAADHNKSRKTYKLIKEVNGKWKPQQRAVKNKDGALLQDDREIRRRWTEYCSDLYNNTETHERSQEVMKDLEKISPAADERNQHC